ncbi:hypothetical protein CQW23_30252 [Capsicum baccatum]|uniref:Uncharacterized protein n=1 Tax=Capsicum baccatum TaxID=33114 RepID=A0A2G2VAY7_CAPBA|nr:hypothetical protein CQW23_30252 [Capsicum baccatum]
MGLESIPAGLGSKPQKASAFETWSNVEDKLGARPGGSDKKDIDFEMAEIKSSEQGLERFRAKCALTYPTRYFYPLEDEADLVGNSLYHHSTDSYLSSSRKSSSMDSVDDEPLFPEPDRDFSDCVTSLSTRRSCRELIHNISVNKQSITTSLHSLPFSVSATQHLGAPSSSGFADCELDKVLCSSKDHVLSLNLSSDNVILLDFVEIHSTISAFSWPN